MLPLTRSRNRARFFGIPFSPSKLFSAGEQGFFYDPSDLSTLFQDSAGTTPVTGVEQVVGLMLDKSGNANNATSTGAARPTLSARVNLLTKTEQFDDGVWIKAGATVSATNNLAPDGTNTADTLLCNSGGGRHVAIITALTGINITGNKTASVYLKKGNHNFITLVFLSASNNSSWIALTVNFSGTTPVISQTGAGANGVYDSSTITLDQNGFYRVTLVGRIITTDCHVEVAFASSASPVYGNFGEESWGALGTETVIVWGADLRVANDGVGIPAYQRVNTATDYDSSGFPLYLSFGGTQAMSTGSIDFTATDKMSVFAGVRKLSDSGAQVISELSATVGSNNGSFATIANVNAAGNTTAGAYGGLLKGTTALIGADALSLNAPISNVVAQQMDIAAASDAVVFRVDGVQVDTSGGASAGSGNFGNYPLYIGARAGTSLFFNGRLYSLIGVGSAVSAGNISATESWVNGRTKAF